jgi:hypothetical protein
MTDPTQTIPAPDARQEYRNAKAEAKAAKAYAKATRPWFKKKHIIFPLALIAVIAVIAAANSGGGSGTTTSSVDGATSNDAPADSAQDAAPAEEKAVPGIGDKVRDGKFQFTVTKVKTSVAEVGDQYLNKKAQGQFVLVSVKIANIGDKPQTMFGDNQKLFIKGNEYSADTEAAIYAKNSKVLWEEINPGNSVKGVIIFDVPKAAKKFDKIELHDSMFSGGVDVSLAGA